MIETVVLDLGGVAARFRPERRLEALARLSGVSEKTIEERIFDSGFEHRAELGAYSYEEVIAEVKRLLACGDSDAALVDAWALAFEPDPGILAYLAALPARKALFTNNGPLLDACLAGPLKELAAAFDEVVCSWQLGACKPDVLAFERAASRLDASPDRLLLLDDSPANVEAALACGWDGECVSDLDGVVAAVEGRRLLPRGARRQDHLSS